MVSKRTKSKESAKAVGLSPRQLTANHMEGRFPTPITRQMGHAAYLVADGRMFCFITRDGDVALKLSFARVDELLADGSASPLRMGKRTMRGWVTMPESDSRELVKLMHEAKVFVESSRVVVRKVKPPVKSAVPKRSQPKNRST